LDGEFHSRVCIFAHVCYGKYSTRERDQKGLKRVRGPIEIVEEENSIDELEELVLSSYDTSVHILRPMAQ
jgi:hypothetical protein